MELVFAAIAVIGVPVAIAAVITGRSLRNIWHTIPQSNDDFGLHMETTPRQRRLYLTPAAPATAPAPAAATWA